MTKHTDDNDSSSEAFDDILFSSSGNDDKAVKEKSTTAEQTFSTAESFDDILFGDDSTVEKAFDEAKAEKLSADKLQAPPNSLNEKLPESTKIPAPIATPTAPTATPKPNPAKLAGAVTSIDEPIGDDSFLEGALFNDDDEYIDGEANADQAPSLPDGTASDDAELMQEAIFSSTEDFEQATDSRPGEIVVESKKVKAPVEKTPEHVVTAAFNTQFTSLLTRSSQADAFIGKAPTNQKQLIAENDAINGSFPLVQIDPKPTCDRPSETEKDDDSKEEEGKFSIFTRKARGNVNEFLGAEIEGRTIPLEFKFPIQQGKKEVGEAPNKKLILAYLNAKGAKTTTLLKRAEHDISLISKHKLSAPERERLLETFLPMLFDRVPKLIASFERKPFDPANIERFEQLTLSIDSLKGVISGYKQVYAHYYGMNNFNYKRKQTEANHCAYELVQLLYLEMRLMQASKIPFTANSIKSINKIAIVIRHYEPNFFSGVRKHPAQASPKSIETLWKKYQLYLCFDHLAISAKLNTALESYLDNYVIDKTEFIGLDECNYHPQSQLLHIQLSSDRRGRLLQLEDASTSEADTAIQALQANKDESVLLAVSDLFNQIKNDYHDCFLLLTGAKQQHGCESINSLGKEDALCLFAYLNQQIEIVECNNKKPFYSIYTPVEIEIRTGLDDISTYYHSLVSKWKDDLEGPKGGPQEKSNQFGHKGWGIANENDEHIYLQGTLQASTPYLDCGEVICLSRVSSDGVYSHELAVIKELNLSNLHQPQIVAQKITADIVGLCSTQGFKPVHGREAMEKYPVLENGLIGNKDGESFLLTSTANHLVSDALLRITLPDDKSFIIKTHQLHFISPATMLFSLA